MSEQLDFNDYQLPICKTWDDDEQQIKARQISARKLYSCTSLHKSAEAFAGVHPRALQYLEQAPVMALEAIRAVHPKCFNSFYQQRILRACADGWKLARVMEVFNYPLTLRKLSGAALSASHKGAVRGLARHLTPADLGNLIPDRPGEQREWLRQLEGVNTSWHQVTAEMDDKPSSHFRWWAERCMDSQEAGNRTACHAQQIMDYMFVGGQPFNDKWSWARALEESDLWHERVQTEQQILRQGMTPKTVIDRGEHPGYINFGEYTVVSLRTPESLVEEGRAMRHCVGSYVNKVCAGSSHIFSFRKGKESLATLELDRQYRQIQFKGVYNADPSPIMHELKHKFASEPAMKHMREVSYVNINNLETGGRRQGRRAHLDALAGRGLIF